MSQTTAAGSRKRLTPLGIIFALLGLALFAYFVKRAGIGQIADGIWRLGAGFLLILVISAVRQKARFCAWNIWGEDPYRIKLWDAFTARVVGDAFCNVLSFSSFVISSPSNTALLPDFLP